MRYFIVTYYTKPNGKIDEQVEISKNLKDNDLQIANIIIDFKDKKILKSIIQGQIITTNYDQLVEHFEQVYPDYIEELKKLNSE